MKRIRVLLVGNGKYVHVRRWALGLKNAGCEVLLLSKSPFQAEGVQLVHDEPPPASPWRPFRWAARRRRHHRSLLRRLRPDVVHVQAVNAHAIPPDSLLAAKLVVSPWGSDIVRSKPESKQDWDSKRTILQAADRVMCLSNMLRGETLRYCPLDEDKVQTVYWGVDLEQFHRTRAKVEKPVIGFFKHLSLQYGPVTLVQALAQVAKRLPNVRLILVGNGELEPQVSETARRLHVDQLIDWRGKMEHAALPDVYQRCALTVMPSELPSETLGVSALESQALEIPVVASRIGGIPESVSDGTTGLLVPPAEPNALAEAMLTLLCDRERRYEMGIAGRKYVEEFFDWRKTIATTVNAYHELLDRAVLSERKLTERPDDKLSPLPSAT